MKDRSQCPQSCGSHLQGRESTSLSLLLTKNHVVVLKVTPSHLFIPDMPVTSVFGCVGLMESWTKIDMVQKTLQFSASLSSPGSTRNRVPVKCFGCKRLWHMLQSEGRGTGVTITHLISWVSNVLLQNGSLMENSACSKGKRGTC